MSDQLAKDLQDKATIADTEAKPAPKKFNFNFQSAAKKTFTPGTSAGFVPGQFSPYGGAQANQGYNPSAGGFTDFRSLANSNANAGQSAAAPAPAPVDNTMTLDQFQNQNTGDLNRRVAPAKKVISIGGAKKEAPKVLSLGKPAAAAAASAEASKEATPAPAATPKEATPAPKESTPAAAPKAATPKAAATPKESTPAAKSGKDTKESTPAPTTEEEDVKFNEEVMEDMFGGENVKEHMSILFMGHVDAGKSTMGGNLLHLTGSVDKRTVEKYEREAVEAGRQGWYLSWVMDTNKEERNEGKTIEVGRAVFETEKRRYTILDAPGHKMYVPSMIGGASQADVGVLVISARKGEYETGFEKGGQTREHAVLAKTQGVDKLVVVVNKMDDPTVNWSQERYDECTKKLGVFLKGTGYTDVTYMPVSGFTGVGIKDRVGDVCPWYTGPSLLEFLDGVSLENRKLNSPFMLPISGKSKDLGTVVEGKIEAGTVKKGTSLLMMPNRVPVEVAAIYNESEVEIPGAISGEQVKLKLKGIEEEDVQIGFVLTSAKNPIHAVSKFEAQVAIAEVRNILTAGYSCVMHVHTAVEEVTFAALLHKLEKGTNRKSKKPPAFVKRGMRFIARLELESPLCVEEFAKLPQLGRFTLRDQGTTVAIGKITKILE